MNTVQCALGESQSTDARSCTSYVVSVWPGTSASVTHFDRGRVVSTKCSEHLLRLVTLFVPVWKQDITSFVSENHYTCSMFFYS